jgi:hypothetical protein
MGNQTSKEKDKSKEKSKPASKNETHGMFNKELKHSFDFKHSYKDPYIPLVLIQAHSIEPETAFELPEGIHLFHYCKKGCILRTKRLKRNAATRTKDELNTEFRSVSMEYACLKQLDVYDKYEKTCPQYQFYIDEDTKQEGGIYICLDKEIHKIFTFEPGQTYPMGMVIPFIQAHVDRPKIHIGILSCRTTEACSDVIVALPGKASNHSNKLNAGKIHKTFKRTLNRKGEKNREGLPASLAILKRKRTRKNNSH